MKTENADMEIIPVELPPRIRSVVIAGEVKYVNVLPYHPDNRQEDHENQQAASHT